MAKTGFWKQVGLLLWKNGRLYWKHRFTVVLEISLPILFALFMVIRRSTLERGMVKGMEGVQLDLEKIGSWFNKDMVIGYLPKYPSTQNIMNDVTNTINEKKVTTRGFSDEASLVSYYLFDGKRMPVSVVFHGFPSEGATIPKAASYTIRPAYYEKGWRTNQVFSYEKNNYPRGEGPEYDGIVINLITLVGEAILRQWGGAGSTPTLKLMSQTMPFPPYYNDLMSEYIQLVFPNYLALSFIVTVVQTTKAMILEKEKRIKDSMKLMGLKSSAHWASWFITTLLYLCVAITVCCELFAIEFNENPGAVLNNMHISLFWVFLLTYAIAIISFCFMISALVKRAKVGAAVSGIVFLILLIPSQLASYETMSLWSKLSFCLFFNTAMAFGVRVIGMYEGTNEGVKWNNFWSPAIVDDNFTLAHAMGMLLLDTFLHLLIAWYMDNVWPEEFRAPKPFYFCFMRNYWCSTNPRQTTAPYNMNMESQGVNFEKDPTNLTPGIQICNLSKAYGKKTAVDKMQLNMYEGQITALLGLKGAGKTTLISLITGALPPTSGTALVNGFDICKDIEGVRSSLGLCSQKNLIWNSLTVEEHLRFYAELKGCESVPTEVWKVLKEVGLESTSHVIAKKLSYGQQRKLSVGIALIAESRTVILDEPTSGLDPGTRRQMWDLLKRNCQGRTILLTTNQMEEADILGDRIAIMADGEVKCCGSSHFLKKLFGTGYHLVVVKDQNCKVSKLTEVVRSKVPTSMLKSEVKATVTYLLPDDQSVNFPDLFRYLESHKNELSILGFNTSATTLEEVFLKVSQGSFDVIQMVKKVSHNLPSQSTTDFNINSMMASNHDFTKLKDLSLQWSQFYGMFVKKAMMSWRHRVISVLQIAVPIIFTLFSYIITLMIAEKKLIFDLYPFGQTYVVYSNGTAPDNNTQSAAMWYKSLFSGHALKEVDLVTSYHNMSHYLLELAKNLTIRTYNEKVIIGAQFDAFNGNLKATAFYNMQPYHALPISLMYLLNALAKHLYGSSYSFSLSIDPLSKYQEKDEIDTIVYTLMHGFVVGSNVVTGMTIVLPIFVYFLIKEKEVGAKHLQVLSGVTPGMFWLATFVWDIIVYLLPSLAILVILAAFNDEAYVQGHRLGLVFLVLLLYGWASLSFHYLASFFFKSAGIGTAILITFNVISGMVTSIGLVFTSLPIPEIQEFAKPIDWILILLFPNYGLISTFMNINANYMNTMTCEKLKYKATCLVEPWGVCCKSFGGQCKLMCREFNENYLAWENPGIGRYLLVMAIQGFVFLALVLAVEFRVFEKRQAGERSDFSISKQEDNDVAAERERIKKVKAGQPESDRLTLVNLHKSFGSLRAVDHICVGVPEQECFGLLGQDGAGKSTILKVLTGDVSVTSGNAYLDQYSIVTQIKEVQQRLGYCPQFDALLDTMTGRETVRMYARLRGVPSSHIEVVVDNLMDLVMLEEYKDIVAVNYSGGNKRKLSMAIALIGDPPLLLLDEPTTGVDPVARRQIWTIISQMHTSGRTIILTSHSMEECDALCTRLAILDNGAFRCLGSPQHLKNKFGQGYTLVVKMGLDENGALTPNEPVINFILKAFDGATINNQMEGHMIFQIPQQSANLAHIFDVMENSKQSVKIENYTVHETTLEKVFLTLIRHQVVSKPQQQLSPVENCFCLCCIFTGLYFKE